MISQETRMKRILSRLHLRTGTSAYRNYFVGGWLLNTEFVMTRIFHPPSSVCIINYLFEDWDAIIGPPPSRY